MKKRQTKPVIKVKKAPLYCHDCTYCNNPRNLSVKGVPTLADCKFKQWAVLWQSDECDIGKYRKR